VVTMLSLNQTLNSEVGDDITGGSRDDNRSFIERPNSTGVIGLFRSAHSYNLLSAAQAFLTDRLLKPDEILAFH
jgi:hypothetical protein